MKSSAVIIVAINTPYLMEFGGRYVNDEWCSVDEIEWAIKRGLEGSESDLILTAESPARFTGKIREKDSAPLMSISL